MSVKAIYTILLLFVLGLSNLSSAQSSIRNRKSNVDTLTIDEIKQQLEKAQSLKKDSPESSLEIVQNLLKTTLPTKNHKSTAECYQIIGEINESINEPELATENYDLAIKYYLLSDINNDFKSHGMDPNRIEDLKIKVKLIEKKSKLEKSKLTSIAKDSMVDFKILDTNSKMTISKNAQYNSALVKDKVNNGTDFMSNNLYDMAAEEFNDAEILANNLNNIDDKLLVYSNQVKLYEDQGDTINAYIAMKKLEEQRALNSSFLQSRGNLLKKQTDIINENNDYFLSAKERELIQRNRMLKNQQIKNQQLLIYGLLLIVLILSTSFYFIYKKGVASRRANQLLALKSLRSQMNPHFIFNALNSVNNYISLNDERAANKFLTDFSKLMRLVLENSQLDFISLKKEVEIVNLYVQMEHNRFREKFKYSIEIDESIQLDSYLIPPMLLQPYIENAIWHGLRYKTTPGYLEIKFLNAKDSIEILVSDNGIGRLKSKELKTENQQKQQSVGMYNINERLKIINKVYKQHNSVYIANLSDDIDCGTIVKIQIQKKNQL